MNRELWERANELHASWPNQESKRHLHGLLGLLSNRQDNDSRILRAYLAYHFPCEETYRICVESELLSVVRTAPANTTALLYLAHYYYDNCEYHLALTQLNKLNPSTYEKEEQYWRALKIRELALASRLYMDASSVEADDVSGLLTDMMQLDASEVSVPVELVCSLAANKPSIDEAWEQGDASSIGQQLRHLVDLVAGEDVLEEEIEALRQ